MMTAAATREGGCSEPTRSHSLTPSQAARSRRVIILLVSIVLLSLADLLITVTNLHTVGMIEAKPLRLQGASLRKLLSFPACARRARGHERPRMAAWRRSGPAAGSSQRTPVAPRLAIPREGTFSRGGRGGVPLYGQERGE